MPLLHTFSFISPSVKKIHFSAAPFSLSVGDAVLEIDLKEERYIAASSKQFLLNNSTCFYSEVKSGDLILLNDTFLVFDGGSSCILLGDFNHQGSRALAFKLPGKISDNDFNSIARILLEYSGVRKVYIDCSRTEYMDTPAIAGMIELVKRSNIDKRSIHFYLPNNKFKSYLTLANIRRQIPVAESRDVFVDQCALGSPYKVSLKGHHYVISAGNLWLVGRHVERCSIILTDRSISRIHALLLHIKGTLHVADCRSTNRTFVNGMELSAYSLYPLKPGDAIVFGKLVEASIACG